MRTGTPSRYDRFNFLSARHTAADFVDHALHVEAHWQLVDAGPIHVARDGVEAGTAIPRCAKFGVPFATAQNHCRNGAESLDVVDDGGAAVQADNSREGRANARITALAFERFHERGFLAAFIGTSAGMREQVKIEPASQNIFAEIPLRVGFRDGRVDNVDYIAIFATNVDEAAFSANGASSDDHPFDQLVRIHFHQRPVFAGARFAFIAIGDDVLWFSARLFGDEAPFHVGREAGAAASAQIRFFYFVDNLCRRHLLQRFFQRLIAVVLQIDVNFVRVGNSEAAADDHNFGGMTFVNRAGNHRDRFRTLALLELFENRVDFGGIEIFVEIIVHLNRRRTGTGTDAFHFLE